MLVATMPGVNMAFPHIHHFDRSAESHIAPASPTLTNPDMILPDVAGLSPTLSERTPTRHDGFSNLKSIINSKQVAMNHAPEFAQTRVAQVRPMRPLSDIAENDVTNVRRASSTSDTLASSPTLLPADRISMVKPAVEPDRRLSSGSVSVTSEDLDNINLRWPGFTNGDTDDLSLVEGEDEDKFGQFPEGTPGTEMSEDDQWLGSRGGEVGAYSSLDQDPLSRRADMILANAKKRLNMMEGNLRGARNSLLLTNNNSLTRSQSVLGSPFNSTYRNRDTYGSRTPSGHRPRQFSPSPLSSISTLANGQIEYDPATGATQRIHSSLSLRGQSYQKRSSSALGGLYRIHGINPVEQPLSPLRGVRSHEVMRDARVQSWMAEIERPSNADDVDEDEAPSQQPAATTDHTITQHAEDDRNIIPGRPDSAAAGQLRTQIDDLKDRISSLKEKAREESIKRNSLSHLRTPSTFTDADRYNDVDSKDFASRSAGLRLSPSPLVSPSKRRSPGRSISEYSESHYEDAEEDVEIGMDRQDVKTIFGHEGPQGNVAVHGGEMALYGNSSPGQRGHHEYLPVGGHMGETSKYDAARQEEVFVVDENENNEDYIHDQNRDYAQSLHSESDATSVYYDSVAVPPERHEDRADAFDYQNFFLHSAMGSYSQAALNGDRRRRDRSVSVGSEDSVETTRPIEAGKDLSAVDGYAEEGEYFDVEEEDDNDGLEDLDAVEEQLDRALGDTEDDELLLAPVRPPFARHDRSQSTASISTLDTFITATDGHDLDDDDREQASDRVVTPRKAAPAPITTTDKTTKTPLTSKNAFVKPVELTRALSPARQAMNGPSPMPMISRALPPKQQHQQASHPSSNTNNTVAKHKRTSSSTSASTAPTTPRYGIFPNSNVESIISLLIPPCFPTTSTSKPTASASMLANQSPRDSISSSSTSSESQSTNKTSINGNIYPLKQNDKKLLIEVVKALQGVCREAQSLPADAEDRTNVRERLERAIEILRGD